jgi:6-phosphogluconolactonase
MGVRVLNKGGVDVRICEDAQDLAAEAASHFAQLADQYAVGAGRFTVALSGGSTPRAMFTLLAAEPFKQSVPWPSIYFFWGDERAVPPTHSGSNYRMAKETLLSKVPVPAENIFRIHGELEDRDRAASEYSESLSQFFYHSGSAGTSPLANWPRFDLVLLGMGADGHTASLFPNSPALQISDRIAAANYVQKLNAHRITLTAPTINNARNVTFLVAGEDKAAALRNVIEGSYNPQTWPSQLIKPRGGKLLWLVDEGAASRLGS